MLSTDLKNLNYHGSHVQNAASQSTETSFRVVRNTLGSLQLWQWYSTSLQHSKQRILSLWSERTLELHTDQSLSKYREFFPSDQPWESNWVVNFEQKLSEWTLKWIHFWDGDEENTSSYTRKILHTFQTLVIALHQSTFPPSILTM